MYLFYFKILIRHHCGIICSLYDWYSSSSIPRLMASLKLIWSPFRAHWKDHLPHSWLRFRGKLVKSLRFATHPINDIAISWWCWVLIEESLNTFWDRSTIPNHGMLRPLIGLQCFLIPWNSLVTLSIKLWQETHQQLISVSWCLMKQVLADAPLASWSRGQGGDPIYSVLSWYYYLHR